MKKIKKPYVEVNGVDLFGHQKTLTLKRDERYYQENVDEMKNLAALHMVFTEYLRLAPNSSDASRKFEILREQAHLNHKVKHSQFRLAL